MRKSLWLVALLGAGYSVQAQDSLKTTQLDELVFTGSRMEISKEKSGKMIYKISADDLQTSGVRSVPDILNQIPGVQMDGNFGAPGTNIDYFVRGAASKRTLILIDGIPFNDPSGIDLNYDLRLLNPNNIESIEVLRGGLSSLYGSGAASAVIYIKTKKEADEALSGNLSFEFGSYGTQGGGLTVNGRDGKVFYGFSGNFEKSEGFSAAKGERFERDGMTSENASVNVGLDLLENWSIEVLGSTDQFENEFDAWAYVDDATSGSQYFQNRVGIKSVYKGKKGSINASFFKNNLERRFNYSGFGVEYMGTNSQSNLQFNQQLISSINLVGGVDIQQLSYFQPSVEREEFTSQAPYLSLSGEFGSFNFQIGGRVNNHSVYGSQIVYNVNPSYSFDLNSTTLKILSNYSTSYVTPSLYQLKGFYGNTGLMPELSESWDFGFSIYDQGLELNAVYFQRKDTDPIDFQSFFDDAFNFVGGQYYNREGLLWVEGVELDMKRQLGAFTLTGNYTWLNNIRGQLRQRVPRLKYGLDADYRFSDSGSVSLNYNWTGKRAQLNPLDYSTVKTDSFGLLDVRINHDFGRLSLTGSVNNILDEQYDAILGYTTMGRNYMLRLNIDLGK